MKRPKVLPVFTSDEYYKIHLLLASKVATMLGRKLEEGDWNEVYCGAKGIPFKGWSNLNIDVIHGGLGVEQKMLCVKSGKRIKEFCGTTLMHPAATRSIRIPGDVQNATQAAQDVLSQYAGLVNQRTAIVQETSDSRIADMRTGWLLWQTALIEFIYFEEEMLPPNPSDFYAEWVESGGGTRKSSRNLWVFESKTGKKRYSITTSAGAKIQPYFDIPPPDHPNLYYFRVQGEQMEDGTVRIWLTRITAIALEQLVGTLDPDSVSDFIVSKWDKTSVNELAQKEYQITAVELRINPNAYRVLRESFEEAVSDEHLFQLLVASAGK